MKMIFAYVMGVFYIIAGFMHFLFPASYLKIMPTMLPYPLMLVYLSGAAEVLCGMGLLFNETRVAAAWATIVLLLAIFPANINMAMHPGQFDIAPWILNLRLPSIFIDLVCLFIYQINS